MNSNARSRDPRAGNLLKVRLARVSLFRTPRPAFARMRLLRLDRSRAFLQRVFQVDWHAVFLEQIG